MRKVPLLFALATVLPLAWFTSATCQSPADNPAAKPEPRDQANWKSRHAAFLDKAKEGPYDLVFLGDSITQGWEGNGKAVWAEKIAPFKPFNLGIGGDRTQHVLWRITTGKELEGVTPKAAVIMIGTNNISSDSAENIAAAVKAIVAELQKQKPGIKVLLLGVFPRSGKSGKELKDVTVVPPADQQPKVKAINDILAKMDDGKSVKYLDIGDKFLDKNGALPKSIMPDFLHLSTDGYKIWADAIDQPLKDLLKG